MCMIDLQETGYAKPIFLQICYWDSRGLKAHLTCPIFCLTFIRSSRELGFSSEQVRTFIHLSEPQNLTCTEARDLSKTQLTAVRKRIKELRMIEVELSKHLIACDDL